jgi:hypothetical protein
MVIFIIGILAGVVLLSTLSTSDAAKASVLVSNLRNAKAAGIVWFAENIDSGDADLSNEWTGVNMPSYLRKYVDTERINDLIFVHITNVGYLVGEPGVPRAVIKKAIGQAGTSLVDENGVVLSALGGDAVVCVKVK